MIANAAWPVADLALMEDDSATLPIQINGKRRREITMAKDLDKAAIETIALGEPAVITAFAGARPKKIIFVPGRDGMSLYSRPLGSCHLRAFCIARRLWPACCPFRPLSACVKHGDSGEDFAQKVL